MEKKIYPPINPPRRYISQNTAMGNLLLYYICHYQIWAPAGRIYLFSILELIMNNFIKKTTLFIISITLLYLLLYISIDYYYNYKKDKSAIFIWGDSQTYEGINLQVIRNFPNKQVYTYAKHGAGVYDFLVFSEKVA